jgi:RNA polymerase sigma-70 factor (ECF subfamily)
VGPWLYSVTVNACRDIGRERQRSRLVPMENWASLAPADPEGNPEGLCADQEREEHLRTVLRRLPEKERAALLLREMEGLTTEEVARVLGSSASTVCSQICTRSSSCASCRGGSDDVCRVRRTHRPPCGRRSGGG